MVKKIMQCNSLNHFSMAFKLRTHLGFNKVGLFFFNEEVFFFFLPIKCYSIIQNPQKFCLKGSSVKAKSNILGLIWGISKKKQKNSIFEAVNTRPQWSITKSNQAYVYVGTPNTLNCDMFQNWTSKRDMRTSSTLKAGFVNFFFNLGEDFHIA